MRKLVFTGFFFVAAGLPMAAQVGTTPNVISGCVGNLTGIFREVPNANYCLKGLETFQEFNITGPQGPAGPQGVQGVAGPAGVAGPQGVAGAKGATGSTGTPGAVGSQGPQGVAGPAGATGAQGAAGPAGSMGLTGSAGATGAQGPIGLTGAAGATGAQGSIGLTGAAGATGAQGPIGVAGAAGPQGATGPQGAVGQTGAAGATGAQGPIGFMGAAGATGATGEKGVNYRGAFSNSTAYSTGDVVLYLNALYYATVANGGSETGALPVTGSNIFSLFLPQGATGATGAQGTMGTPGINGQAGAAGATGAQGPAGTGSGLLYTIHYYFSGYDIPGVGTTLGVSNGGNETTLADTYCPASETLIAASCGYNPPNGVVTGDQADITVNSVMALGLNSPPAGFTAFPAECLITNRSTDSRGYITGASCLATTTAASASASATATATGQVVKSCSYDPDTQSPCTAADATVATAATAGGSSFKAAAQVASPNASVSSPSNGPRKIQKQVTLWFNQ